MVQSKWENSKYNLIVSKQEPVDSDKKHSDSNVKLKKENDHFLL